VELRTPLSRCQRRHCRGNKYKGDRCCFHISIAVTGRATEEHEINSKEKSLLNVGWDRDSAPLPRTAADINIVRSERGN